MQREPFQSEFQRMLNAEADGAENRAAFRDLAQMIEAGD